MQPGTQGLLSISTNVALLLINYVQPCDQQDVLHWGYWTQLWDNSSAWGQPQPGHSLSWRQGAKGPISLGTSLGQGELCHEMAVTRRPWSYASFLRSCGNSYKNTEVPTFPASALWCRLAAGKWYHFQLCTYTKSVSAHTRMPTEGQTEHSKKEWEMLS